MLWVLLVTSFVQHDCIIRDRVDVIERNHYYNSQGDKVFTQWIFWSWYSDIGERVVAWRMNKRNELPVVCCGGEYVLRWQDGKTFREVRAWQYRETHTQFDPEIADRNILPKEQRRQLTAKVNE